jgi:replicative DNA helicase
MLYSNVFEHGYSAVFFSFEMPRDQIWAAIICRHAYSMGFELDSMKAKKALFSDDEKEKYYMASKDFHEKSKGNLYILNPEDFLDVSPLAFKHMVSIMDKENGSPVDIIALDYLQRMKGYRISKMDEKEAMNSYVLAFNDMAISHNGKKRCVFLLSQVNREGIKKAEKGGKASMVFFAEASEIERSASTGIILHASDSMKLSNQLQLTVVKRRHGSVIADPIITYANGMYTLIGNVGFQEIFTEDSMSIIGEEDDADFI